MKLEILLNRNCNYSCEYCGIYDNKVDEKSNVSLDKLNEILSKGINGINGMQISEVVILGGEPTINKNFVNVVFAIWEHSIPIYVYTNGHQIPFKVLRRVENKVSFILSYHSSQTSLRAFCDDVDKIKDYCKIDSIITMWSENLNTLMDFKILNKKYPKIHQALEPIFDIQNGKMIKDDFHKFNSLGLLHYSDILNIQNKYLDISFYDMFELNLEKKSKVCHIDNFSLTLDYMEGKTYTCLTHCLNKTNKNGNCELTWCLQDLEYITEIL